MLVCAGSGRKELMILQSPVHSGSMALCCLWVCCIACASNPFKHAHLIYTLSACLHCISAVVSVECELTHNLFLAGSHP